jgi:hypothetical protein
LTVLAYAAEIGEAEQVITDSTKRKTAPGTHAHIKQKEPMIKGAWGNPQKASDALVASQESVANYP